MIIGCHLQTATPILLVIGYVSGLVQSSLDKILGEDKTHLTTDWTGWMLGRCWAGLGCSLSLARFCQVSFIPAAAAAAWAQPPSGLMTLYPFSRWREMCYRAIVWPHNWKPAEVRHS